MSIYIRNNQAANLKASTFTQLVEQHQHPLEFQLQLKRHSMTCATCMHIAPRVRGTLMPQASCWLFLEGRTSCAQWRCVSSAPHIEDARAVTGITMCAPPPP